MVTFPASAAFLFFTFTSAAPVKIFASMPITINNTTINDSSATASPLLNREGAGGPAANTEFENSNNNKLKIPILNFILIRIKKSFKS
ncbi:MAG: hypothetical protein BWZ05_01693 [Bacteroidetes bacterium ADurb.BinA245]|nr:MAG: hypothetical protein BWZ05_01693 [Bacteroidetes bacterium ADurb.BinA245]